MNAPKKNSRNTVIYNKYELGIFIISVILGFSLLMIVGLSIQTRFDELGLGYQTSVVPESWTSSSGPAICMSPKEVLDCLPKNSSSLTSKHLLWVGYSQLYGINRYQSGDRAAPFILRELLKPDGIQVGAIGLGKVNPRELLLSYEYTRAHTQLDMLVVGAWLQGTKEDGIRPTVQEVLNDQDIVARIAKLPSGPGILAQRGERPGLSGQYAQVITNETSWSMQEKTETALVNSLKGSAFWHAREAVASTLSVAFRDSKSLVMIFRNFILGLKAKNWVIQIPASRYEINIQAFSDLLDQAHSDGVKVLVYVPPRPVDEKFPFDPDVYAAYKKGIADLATKYGAEFVNLEDAVRGDVWGKIDNSAGEIVTDFTHFSADGHNQFANALAPHIRKLLGGHAP